MDMTYLEERSPYRDHLVGCLTEDFLDVRCEPDPEFDLLLVRPMLRSFWTFSKWGESIDECSTDQR